MGAYLGAFEGTMAASWPLLLPFSVTFGSGGVSLCYRHLLSLAIITNSTSPCPPEPAELSGRSGRIATFIIFFSFSFHRLIFQEALSLLYRKAERGVECKGVWGGGTGATVHEPSRFFFSFLDRSFSMQGYQGVWPIIGMQIAADGVPQQKKGTG